MSSELTTLDRWITSLRWRDKLPLVLTIALLVSVPAALMQRLENAVAVRNTRNAAAPTPYKLTPVYTPLPHHWSNGIVVLYAALNPDGTVARLQNGWHDVTPVSNQQSGTNPLYDLSAAAAGQWRFDGGGTTVKLTFLYHDHGETDALWGVDAEPNEYVSTDSTIVPK
jgi:hypothetical protein